MANDPNNTACHSDQPPSQGVDPSKLAATPSVSKAPRVHRGVHKRAREVRMVGLTRTPSGAFRARKRIPNDVRDEYRRVFGQRLEAKLTVPASTKPHVAQQLYAEWIADVLARITAIRAQQKGEGKALTHRQARALAGDWYGWFVARYPLSDQKKWQDLRDYVQDKLRETVSDEEWNKHDPDELWRDEEVRRAVRPVLADVGETAQFLGMKGLALNNEASALFLDNLYDDLSAALRRLVRISMGDYRADKYPERFPKFEGTDSGVTPWELFEKWAAEREPAASTVESWRYVFAAMRDHFKDRGADSIMEEEAQAWVNGLKSAKRTARTVARTYITASRTVFGWAREHKHISRNAFAGVKITIPKRRQLRETKAFRPQEYKIILEASLAITHTKTPANAARRWVPWLCAYTGARSGEITQLRGCDVVKREGIHAILITPEAGTVKGGRVRVVPLHPQLIAQGFLKFVEGRGKGPLFYKPSAKDPGSGTKRRKPRATQVRQRLATWVRTLGITDTELQPNHAWRHTFKQIADRVEISERMSNYITGHAHRNVGAGYGAPTLGDMARAMKKFPRYTFQIKR